MERFEKLEQRLKVALRRISRSGNWQKWIAVYNAWHDWTFYQEV